MSPTANPSALRSTSAGGERGAGPDAGIRRAPAPRLRPFVKTLWATGAVPDRPAAAPHGGAARSLRNGTAGARERVLPAGTFNLVFRLSEHRLCLFRDAEDRVGEVFGSQAIVGGARASAYVKEVSPLALSVGAELQPGVADRLFGAAADQLAGRHTALEDLWGRDALDIHERLTGAGSPGAALALLESLLMARLSRFGGPHPVVAHALARLGGVGHVGAAVAESGYSHRRFIALFRKSVGLTPKLYCRVTRFAAMLDRLNARPGAPWVELALATGYSDQSHFNRDFRELAGVTPGTYRALAPTAGRHVPIPSPHQAIEPGQIHARRPAVPPAR